MTDEQRDKLRRAIALPGWRWMARMVDDFGDTVLSARDSGVVVVDRIDTGTGYELRPDHAVEDWSENIPDPNDPATAGCLLALLATEDEGAALHGPNAGGPGWLVEVSNGQRYVSVEGPSLGWACIEAALALGRWPGGE
jgi:hypothetical protein